MSKAATFHAVRDRTPYGWAEAISIRTPQGQELAFIAIPSEPRAVIRAMATARRIVAALNAHEPGQRRKPTGPSQRYYATLGVNGTEDELTIHAPRGDELATIWFWDDPDSAHAARSRANARLIVAALNGYKSHRKRDRQS